MAREGEAAPIYSGAWQQCSANYVGLPRVIMGVQRGSHALAGEKVGVEI